MYVEGIEAREKSTNLLLVDADMLSAVAGVQSSAFTPIAVGDIHSSHSDKIISYVKHPKYVQAANANACIKAVLTTVEISQMLRDDITPLVCEDPTWSFFRLVDDLAKQKHYFTNDIKARSIAQYTSISERGVIIGQGTDIEDFVTIRPGTRVGRNVILRSGAAVGIDTFQHQRTSYGILSPMHDGELIIGDRVEIGASSTISKGFSYRHTLIGSDCKLDAGVYIGHGVEIGDAAIICAGAKIMGHAKIGRNVYIGPGAVISSRVEIADHARVSLGSVVTKNVTAGETVTGNFAISHKAFMAHVNAVGLHTLHMQEGH